MKKSLLLFSAVAIACGLHAQTVVFSSSFENWASTNPTDWMGSATNIAADSVSQITSGTMYGSSAAELRNASTTHKRFTTQPVALTDGQAYNITYWVKGTGSIRAGLYNGTSGVGAYQYATYNALNAVTSWTSYTQTLVADTSLNGQFILSVMGTSGSDPIEVDSFVVTTASVALTSIYQIQYTTAASGDSPMNNQTIATGGIVTAVDASAYWVQSGTGPWTGIYVFDATNAPNLAIGDSVTFSALVTEYFNLTELKNVAGFTKVSSGNALPAVSVVTTAQANMEEYEGVYLKVTNAACAATGLSGNQWTVDDGSGAVFIDDEIYLYSSPAVGIVYDVTGVGHYAFSERKIEPRMASDVQVATGIASHAAKASVKMFPNPSNGSFVIAGVNAGDVVKVYDLSGKVVYSVNCQNAGNANVNITEGNGVYFVQIIGEAGVRTGRITINN